MIEYELKKLEEQFGPLGNEARAAIRYALANYGLACLMDSSVAKEAETVCSEQVNDEEE